MDVGLRGEGHLSGVVFNVKLLVSSSLVIHHLSHQASSSPVRALGAEIRSSWVFRR